MTTLVRRAEALPANDLAFQAETASWMRHETEAPDGVPAIATGPPPYGAGAVSLLRIGYGQTTATTARRAVADVLTRRVTPDAP
ncbi:hypothetical protein [Amycolatopsis sp.]|uniref:hypothetical protein n=1 Tax=Amycolatopsis sp. TaxID=37632 RepID=UPI002D7F5FF3|nr:hypothetical protein [Amycolatopsis sp.]HET6703326.1 hypothetical protein [Amycolatopsis sp.]